MSRRPRNHDQPPTREMVLDHLEKNPSHGAKRDIARGLNVATEHRPELRRILNELESEGALVRTAKRAFQPAEMPPPTGIVKFERLDSDGELIGCAMGREGPYGPDIYYQGSGSKGREPEMNFSLLHGPKSRGGSPAATSDTNARASLL